MELQIIHNYARIDRAILLQKEMLDQGISWRVWPAIMNPTVSFVGVCQAHKQIVRWANQEGLKEVCIGEDDLHFFAPGAWDFFLQNKPEDFDLYLGGVFYGHLDEENVVKDWCGMTLYIVNERFYDTFLGLNEWNNLDRELAFKGRYVVCNPFVVTQHGGYSDNKKYARESYDEYLQGRKLFGVPEIKIPNNMSGI